MSASQTVRVTAGNERASIYPEGGVSFELWIEEGSGWYVNDRHASERIQALAVAVRLVAFPHLAPLTLAELVG